jgi:hypothetical protein
VGICLFFVFQTVLPLGVTILKEIDMNQVKTSNIKCRSLVQSQQPFMGNNLFGVRMPANPKINLTERYVVYSYGAHWPLFVCQDGVWFENQDKYSPTTSKHRTQSHPHQPTMPMTSNAMRRIVEDGVAGLAVLGEAKY